MRCWIRSASMRTSMVGLPLVGLAWKDSIEHQSLVRGKSDLAGRGAAMRGAWTALEIAGKPADVYEQPADRPRFGVLHLHGARGESLRDRPAFTRLFDELGLAC